MLNYENGTIAGLERYAVRPGEFLEVFEGFALVCGVRVLVVSGYLRLDGVARIG